MKSKETLRVLLKDLIKGKNQITDYCRKLIAEGVNPDTRLELFWGEIKGEPDVIVPNVGKAAAIMVLEDRMSGPRFVKYRKPDLSSLKAWKEKIKGTSQMNIKPTRAT